MEIEEYIQNKEYQNQIFHLANHFNIDIKEIIIILNDNNIKLSSYQYNYAKFKNKNLNETFENFSKLNNDVVFDFLKNNSFRKAEKEFKNDRRNLKFWLDINGYDIFSLTNSNKVNKAISKTLEINIKDLVDNKRLNQIKEEIKKGTHRIILKEKFPELNKNKGAWERWFENEKLEINKNKTEEMEIIEKRKHKEFEIKYNDFIFKKINEGFNVQDIRKMIINDFGESNNYCPVKSIIKNNFNEEYKNNIENRMFRYHGTKTNNIAKTDEYKNKIEIKNRLKYQSALLFDKNRLSHKKMFQQYCVSNIIKSRRQIRDLLPKKLNSKDFLNYYDEVFDKSFIFNKNVFSEKEMTLVLNSFYQLESPKTNKEIKEIINKFIKENDLESLFNTNINLIDLTHYSIYYYGFLLILFKIDNEMFMDFFTKETLLKLNIKTKNDFIDYFCKKMNFKKEYIIKSANFLSNEGLLSNKNYNQNCSLPEQKTKDFLERNEINFVQEKTFNDLKFESFLRYDFYLPDFNLLIELDGKQHFKWVSYFDKNINDFEKRKIKDKIKNKYAEENNINLLRIPYHQFKNIELIICDYLINNYNLKENILKEISEEKKKYEKLKEEREQFSCPFCDKKVRSKGNLVQHINKIHNK